MKQSVTLRFYLWHSPSIVVCTYRGRLVSDTLDNDSRGYSGSTSPSSPDRSHSPADIRGESRDLCKQLMRQEERDPFRWGHAGFKELYPDEFASSGEGKSESEKRKERKSHSRKRKREHKDKRKTKRRKLKKSGEGKSEASSKKKRQKAKKKRRERRRDEEQESSASDSDSSSDSEVDEHDRKREKKRTSRHKQK